MQMMPLRRFDFAAAWVLASACDIRGKQETMAGGTAPLEQSLYSMGVTAVFVGSGKQFSQFL